MIPALVLLAAGQILELPHVVAAPCAPVAHLETRIAELELELVETSSTWKRAAGKSLEGAKRWKAEADKRAQKIIELAGDKADALDARDRCQRTLARKPSPEVVTKTPAWVPFAIVGGVVGAAGGAFAGTRLLDEPGAAIGGAVGAAGLGLISAALPLLIEELF